MLVKSLNILVNPLTDSAVSSNIDLSLSNAPLPANNPNVDIIPLMLNPPNILPNPDNMSPKPLLRLVAKGWKISKTGPKSKSNRYLNIPLIISPALEKASVIPLRPLLIPLEILSNIPLLLTPSFIALKNLPIVEVADKNMLPNPENNPPPPEKALNIEDIPVLARSNTENTPLNVSFILPNVLSLTLSFSVNFSKPLDNSISFCPVIAGKISRNASFTEPAILPMLPNTLVNPEIIESLPPSLFHSSNILFLASIPGFIMFSNALLISVNIFVACSLSPTIHSQV